MQEERRSLSCEACGFVEDVREHGFYIKRILCWKCNWERCLVPPKISIGIAEEKWDREHGLPSSGKNKGEPITIQTELSL
jgi:hypothetical protein